jgi:Mg-chelatase subunit ChlD
VQFSESWFLLLLGPATAGTVWLHRRSLAGLPARRASACLIVRLALQSVVVLALAGPSVSLPSHSLALLFLLDRSRSIPSEAQARELELVNRATRHLPPHVRAGVVVFGRDAMPETAPTSPLSLTQVRSVLDRDGTRVSAALRMGLALLPEGTQRRLVLVSDGNETVEEALQEADRAAADGVGVDVVPVAYRYPGEVFLDRLEAPGTSLPGEPVAVRLFARSAASTRGTLRLFRNGALIAERSWTLRPGINATKVIATVADPGFHTWEATLQADRDTLGENNRAVAFTRVSGKPCVLLIEGLPGEGELLARALRDPSLRVERRSPREIPSTPAEWEPFAAALLVNVRADQVAPEAMEVLCQSVRDLGLGCVMVGGKQGLTAGGWRGTPVEEMLPVEMTPPEDRDQAPFALVLVIDRSESMRETLGAAPKLVYALQAAHLAVDALQPEDEIGVIAFDDAPRWVVPLAKRGSARHAQEGIEGIGPGGGTRLHPALAAAYAALSTRRSGVRHVLALTDGRSAPGDFDGAIRQMARSGITVSFAGVGPDADHHLLAWLARRAGGRYLRVDRGESLPAYFEREVRLASRRVLVEETFQPRPGTGAGLVEGLTAAPPLRGYVATTPKDAPQVELPLSSHRDDPIVAVWRTGLGRAAVVTTDARGDWCSPWLRDGQGYYAAFWTRLVRSLLRSADPPGLEASVRIEGEEGQVTVEALTAHGEFRNAVQLEGRVAGPAGESPLQLDQVAPGFYRGSFPAPGTGTYLAAIAETGAPGASAAVRKAEGSAAVIAGAAVPYSPELRRAETNTPLLVSIAERTGGRVWPALGAGLHDEMLPHLFRPGRPARTPPRELWPYLLFSALCLLPLDVGLRRIGLEGREVAVALGLFLGAVALRLRSGRGSPPAAESVARRLLDAKRRATGARDPGRNEDAPERR